MLKKKEEIFNIITNKKKRINKKNKYQFILEIKTKLLVIVNKIILTNVNKIMCVI